MEHCMVWLWFADTFGRGTRRSHEVLERFGSPQALLNCPAEELVAGGLTREELELVRRRDFETAFRQLEDARREGCRLLTPEDAEYPQRLHNIYAKPSVLFLRGSLAGLDDRIAIGVVGARQVDEYGLKATLLICEELARQGAVIVSGMAVGTDLAAHRAAIKAEGVTIGVLGCGIEQDYPKGSRPVKEIAQENGAVLTEYPVGEPGRKMNFPNRNRIISGLCNGVLVVRADEYSGSLITAEHALNQNRDVFAVPCRIDEALSRGSNRLLKQGAKPVTCAEDILSEYRYVEEFRANILRQDSPGEARLKEPRPSRSRRTAAEQVEIRAAAAPAAEPRPEDPLPDYLTAEQRAILVLLGTQPLHADALAAGAGLSTAAVLSTLTELELYGLVENRGPGGYCLP